MEESSQENKEGIITIIVIGILTLVTAVSLYTNITSPRLWVDEGKTVELSRNFLNYSKLDIQVSPGELSKIAPVLQSTGYPVAIPLAFFFKLFGLGPHQARIFMLLWILAALCAAFFVASKIFTKKEALYSFLLIASFASFYDSGRTVVGEIPGFLFLIIGLYYWLDKKDYYKTGLIWGLAVITKPSVFGLIIPTITLTLIERNLESIKKLSKIALGMIPSAIVWFWLVIEGSIGSTMSEITEFYKNPYSSDISSNVLNNLKNIPFSTTFIYFGGLFLVILIARYLIVGRKEDLTKLYNFVIIYSIFAFIYYLRSPGWMRYILISELLILFILPNALSYISEHIKQIPYGKKFKVVSLIVVGLFTIQTTQLFTVADIYSAYDVPEVIAYTNANFPNSTIATLESIEISSFLISEQRYNMLNLTGMPTIGSNPLLKNIFPEIIITKPSTIEEDNIKKIVADKYEILKKIGRYEIYKIKDPK